MQEHIRRAHPEHYIPKLPATEESFLLMINTPPQERTAEQTSSSSVRPGMSHIPNPAFRKYEHLLMDPAQKLAIRESSIAMDLAILQHQETATNTRQMVEAPC